MSHANPNECHYLSCRACCWIAYPLYATGWSANYEGCSAKYQAAKTSGALGGQSWSDFRKTQCGTNAAATPAATPPAVTPAAPKAPGNAVFPTAVSPKYTNESVGKARMHTCLDQYKANKATNANGGLKWIEKGGGYYSECNKQLKG
jgi:hypothetical protein